MSTDASARLQGSRTECRPATTRTIRSSQANSDNAHIAASNEDTAAKNLMLASEPRDSDEPEISSVEVDLYPEQYELHAARSHAVTWTRRDFVKTFTGGLAVLWLLDRTEARGQAESGGAGRGAGRGGNRRPAELAAWLHIAADGTVTLFSGKAEVDAEKKTLKSVAVEIETASLKTEFDKLTNHLNSPDFFDTREYPKAKFESTKITAGKDGEHTITGKLTLLKTTKEISVPAKVAISDKGLTLHSIFKIDRLDYGVGINQSGVERPVSLTITIGGGKDK